MVYTHKGLESVVYLNAATLVPANGAAGSGEYERVTSTSPEWLDEGR